MPEDKAAWAVEQLAARQKELGRIPKKEDFDEATRSRIKAFLGPWPRALEAAGLKDKRERPCAKKQSKKAEGRNI